MPEIHIINEKLPLGALPRYQVDEQTVIVYLSPSKQFARVGPGLKGRRWDCPLLTNLTMAELSKLKLEATKLLPNADQMQVIQGVDGWGLFVMASDKSYVPPPPPVPPFDYSTVPGEQRALWAVCKDPSYYKPNSNAPDCSMDCVKYHKLDGKAGIDWGVCEEPKSPRAGLLTFRHMSCDQYEARPKPEVAPVEQPVTKPDAPFSKKAKAKPPVPVPPPVSSDPG